MNSAIVALLCLCSGAFGLCLGFVISCLVIITKEGEKDGVDHQEDKP